jgi:hypothetical protein
LNGCNMPDNLQIAIYLQNATISSMCVEKACEFNKPQ